MKSYCFICKIHTFVQAMDPMLEVSDVSNFVYMRLHDLDSRCFDYLRRY